MPIFLIVLALLGLIILELLLCALSLYSITKLYNIPGTNFRKSFKIETTFILAPLLLGILVGILLALFGLANFILSLESSFRLLIYCLSISVEAYYFHFLMNRYYHTDIWKNLGILLLSSLLQGFIGWITILPLWQWLRIVLFR